MTNQLDDWLDEQMRDPVFRFWHAVYAPWFWLARLRLNLRAWIRDRMGFADSVYRELALEWEGTARDYGDRLEALGDGAWIEQYQADQLRDI